jgi:hypothetical protein
MPKVRREGVMRIKPGPTNLGSMIALQDACAEKERQITALKKELAKALHTIHWEFCASEKCGCLERVAELRGEK